MAKNTESAISHAFSRHGDSVDGRLFDEAQFRAAVLDIIEVTENEPGAVIIDAMGRIYIDGNHVGWVKRDAGLVELKALAAVMECQLPSLDSMLEIHEGGSNA